jgi:predicted RNase H-like nuclease
MQPSNTSKEMFGKEAPVWGFLERFGGSANPLEPAAGTLVFETYPVLAMISLGWSLADSRLRGRLPKYNPLKKIFSIDDWQHVCGLASAEFWGRELREIAEWINDAAQKAAPNKSDQDKLDACICLLVALYWVEGGCCLMVGDQQTGYIVVPYSDEIHRELDARCDLIPLRGRIGCASSDVINLASTHLPAFGDAEAFSTSSAIP